MAAGRFGIDENDVCGLSGIACGLGRRAQHGGRAPGVVPEDRYWSFWTHPPCCARSRSKIAPAVETDGPTAFDVSSRTGTLQRTKRRLRDCLRGCYNHGTKPQSRHGPDVSGQNTDFPVQQQSSTLPAGGEEYATRSTSRTSSTSRPASSASCSSSPMVSSWSSTRIQLEGAGF